MLKLVDELLTAVHYSVVSHGLQQRNTSQGFSVPYATHPIKVMQILVRNNMSNPDILKASVLHDLIEDTSVTRDNIADTFGSVIADYVVEVTDDKNLTKVQRKQKQLEVFSSLSYGAKCIKLADKTANIVDIVALTPSWSYKSMRAYINHSREMALLAGEMDKDAVLASLIRALWAATTAATEHVNLLERRKEGAV